MELKNFEKSLVEEYLFPVIEVYWDREEFPGKYVALLNELASPTDYYVISTSYTTIKNAMPSHFTRTERAPDDAPYIVERWEEHWK